MQGIVFELYYGITENNFLKTENDYLFKASFFSVK